LDPTFIAWILTMSLGIDTLITSTSLGLKREPGDKVKIALTFAAAESVMPLVGFFIGGALSHYFASKASLIGALMLIGVAIYFLFFDDEEVEKKRLERDLSGWPLITTALSISMDELAVGFSAGFIHVPILLTVMLIASRSFVFTFIGVSFGSKLKPYLGEWAEKSAGIVLALLGVWMLLEDYI